MKLYLKTKKGECNFNIGTYSLNIEQRHSLPQLNTYTTTLQREHIDRAGHFTSIPVRPR